MSIGPTVPLWVFCALSSSLPSPTRQTFLLTICCAFMLCCCCRFGWCSLVVVVVLAVRQQKDLKRTIVIDGKVKSRDEGVKKYT